jgi:hypothetical protein
MRGLGWAFRALVTWDKGVAALQSYHADPENLRAWKDVTEVAGFYQRNAWEMDTCAGQMIQ